MKPYKIILQIPEKYLLFPDSTDHITKTQEIFADYIQNNILEINILKKDYGPATKYQGMIEYYEKKNLINENFVAIILDDDLLYHTYIIEEFYKAHLINNRSLISGYTNRNNLKIRVANHPITPLIKGADANLLPKYFFIHNINPSFKEILENGMNEFKDCVFDDDVIFTSFMYYKKINTIKLTNVFYEHGHDKSYGNHRNIKEVGVSSKGNIYNLDRTHPGKIVHNFPKYYEYDKYSNVAFDKYDKYLLE